MTPEQRDRLETIEACAEVLVGVLANARVECETESDQEFFRAAISMMADEFNASRPLARFLDDTLGFLDRSVRDEPRARVRGIEKVGCFVHEGDVFLAHSDGNNNLPGLLTKRRAAGIAVGHKQKLNRKNVIRQPSPVDEKK